MYKKVLVAEDMDDINKGVLSTLQETGISVVHQVQYCDDAFLKVMKANQDNDPYDLLIVDLSFKEDHRKQEYKSGEDLIKVLREKDIEIPIMVYSGEDRLQMVRRLINEYGVKAYVCKGRNGLHDLKKAIKSIGESSSPFLSIQVEGARRDSSDNDISPYDINLMKHLSKGLSQPEISAHFVRKGISPGSLSSVEKRIIRLKDIFRANNTAHLVALAKDSGFILKILRLRVPLK
ncbi:DNA-binding response regulator, NarL/FixJ family, contains REC and HTH domains [Tenacibaculum sp. MAR_2009_124]|uniref:response regulator transcription factor n=1 Tax=Tenacibaculum sp. MAR_2009_124 TaxID=1250059 RepID=UPI00089A8FA9|nr:response regulator [Tenacibaculum sp. MAR_2009_124]SED12544.1 DNA-binding response regulator, NarL/FixJ family, contains REC and HTH domains [Tenacibaculum sp. MAR_2009_124]